MIDLYWEDYTDAIPEALLDALKQDRLVAFIGAGASRRCYSKTRAPLPDWMTLLHDLVEWGATQRLLDDGTTADLEQLLRRGELLMVAQECREILGDAQLSEFITRVFDPDGVVPARVHELLAAVPFRGFITTNYDNLLERAHVQVHKRQLRTVFPENVGDAFQAPQRSRPLLKLHGDLDNPASIVLGHRDYLRLIWTPDYAAFMRDLLSRYTLLFVGYGLTDLDVLLPLDQLAHEGVAYRHYLLSQRGTRNAVEKKRLSLDRQIELIEYIDYFGFHNHVDTFLEGLLLTSDNRAALDRVRLSLRARIQVHYSPEDEQDGLFVWHYVFREGAVTLSEKPQRSQWERLKKSVATGLTVVDDLVFLVTPASLALSDVTETVTLAVRGAIAAGVHVVFLAAGFKSRPAFLADVAPTSPVFLLNAAFSESDLEPFRRYLAEAIRGGFRQP